MSSLTRHRSAETTRKQGRALLGACCLVVLSGCATPGPNHVYVVTSGRPAVQDLGRSHGNITGILAADEHAVGLAYDFNTDHLFVRVTPAQVIRVIERPSGKILRNMPLPPDLRTDGPADLAIRSSDRHLFAVHPDGRSIVELTLFGEFVRRIEPAGLRGAIRGLAYDQRQRRLLVLTADAAVHVGAVAPEGNVTYYVTFPPGVNPLSLGYDSDAQHYFVPLGNADELGEFDAAGKLVTTHVLDGAATAIDAGPRSFVRVF